MPGPVDCRVATGAYRAWWPGFLERLKMVSNKEVIIKMLPNQMQAFYPILFDLSNPGGRPTRGFQSRA